MELTVLPNESTTVLSEQFKAALEDIARGALDRWLTSGDELCDGEDLYQHRKTHLACRLFSSMSGVSS